MNKTAFATIIVLVAILLTSPSSGLATVGTAESKLVGVSARPDLDTGSLGLGLAQADCKGIPIVAVACALAVATSFEQCIEVSGEAAGFIPVSATACVQAAGSLAISATGSLTEFVVSTMAEAREYGQPYRYETDEEECTTTTYPDPKVLGGDGGSDTITTCEPVMAWGHDVTIHTDRCVESRNQITTSVFAALENPAQVTSWMPGWEANSCDSAVGVTGDYACVELTSHGEAEADAWSTSDDVPMEDCTPKGTAQNTYREATCECDPQTHEDLRETLDRIVKERLPSDLTAYAQAMADTLIDTSSYNATEKDLVRALLTVSIENASTDFAMRLAEQGAAELEIYYK